MAVAIAAAVVGTVGVISNFIGSKKASKAAKEQAAEEAAIEKKVTAERVRQLDVEERGLYGSTLAGYAGGGVLGMAGGLTQNRANTGSPDVILSEQKAEFGKERQITQEVGASNVAQSLMRGKNLADQYKWQGYSNAASSISSILGGFG